MIGVQELLDMFEDSEMASQTARRKSEKARDYTDGIQYTAEELRILNERKQPPVIDNRIRSQVDFLRGYELSLRVDPRVDRR